MDNPTVSLFLALGIIVISSRLAGSLARSLGQPRVLGELLIGVILGPTVLNMLHWDVFGDAHMETTIKELAEFGVLMLMFLVGLEVNIGELVKVGRVAFFAGVFGALLPVVLTLPILLLFGYNWQPALFAGVVLAATSVSISAQVLLEIGVLRTKVGNALLATALIDDILAILLVSLTVALTAGNGAAGVEAGELLGIVIRMALYLVGAFLLSWFVLPRLINWVSRQPILAQSYGIPALALVAALAFAWSAEAFGGVAAITGAFIAGVGLSRSRDRVKHEVEIATQSIAYALLVPIFFVNVGLEINLSTFPLAALPEALVLLAIGVVSKIGGCGAGGRLGGFNNQDSMRLGVCMISRGEVGLIVATLGLSSGTFLRDDPLFSSLFLVILLTTLITPPLVRYVFPRDADRSGSGQHESAVSTEGIH